MIRTLLRARLGSSFGSFNRGWCLAGPACLEAQCNPLGFRANYRRPVGGPGPQVGPLRCHSDLSTLKYHLIYTFPHIKLLRAVSRMKLLQTGLTVALLPPVYALYLLGEAPVSVVTSSTAVALFAGAMLYTASHFFRRVVGMMYLDPSRTTLKVSHLTFWGRRNDVYMAVTDVVPVADTGDAPNERLLVLKRYSTVDTLYFFSHHGRIVDPQGFERVFGSLR